MSRKRSRETSLALVASEMAKIFISHSSHDKPLVRRLARRIEDAGHSVWLDEERLAIGESIVDGVGKALREADFVAVALSPHAVKSRWVMEELNSTLNEQLKGTHTKLLPVVVETCDVPALLAHRVYVDLSQGRKSQSELGMAFNRGVDRIVARLDFFDKHGATDPLGREGVNSLELHPAQPAEASGSREQVESFRTLIHRSLAVVEFRSLVAEDILDAVEADNLDADVVYALREVDLALSNVDQIKDGLRALGPEAFSQNFDVYYRFLRNLEKRSVILQALYGVKDVPAMKRQITRWAKDLKELTADCHQLTRELALALLEEECEGSR